MKWLVPIGVAAAGVVLASRRMTRDSVTHFREDVRHGMRDREAQLREVLAKDTHLSLPGERVAGARAIEGR